MRAKETVGKCKHCGDPIYGFQVVAHAGCARLAGMEEGFILSKVTDPVLLSQADHEELNKRAKAFLDEVKKAGYEQALKDNDSVVHNK